MPKPTAQIDVLVLGDHPCAYLAAALVRKTASIRVAHATIPGEQVMDRLVTVNPNLFELDAVLSRLKRRFDLVPIYGLKFLDENPQISSVSQGRTIAAYVGSLKQIHSELVKLAEEHDVEFHEPDRLQISRLDESGLHVEIDGKMLRPKLLILGGELPSEQKKLIGLSASWDPEVLRRYTYVRLNGSKWHDAGAKPLMIMSLDLRGTQHWAWLLCGEGQIQLAVEQSIPSTEKISPHSLLEHWMAVLAAHGVLEAGALQGADLKNRAVSLDLPMAGALVQEGVANRTLLIGPAGGFYTACAEDIYPNCWSAVHAADVCRKAIKEPHLQDALHPYRQRWGATLGDYLRGPQQNLRYLLPLVFRNAAMTARLTEAILFGKSVVR